MVTVIGFTSISLEDAVREQLLAALNSAGQAVFPNNFQFLLRPFDPRFCSDHAQGLINAIAVIPSTTTMDEKRKLSVALHETTVAVLGTPHNERVTILFWNYEPDYFAQDGFFGAASVEKG